MAMQNHIHIIPTDLATGSYEHPDYRWYITDRVETPEVLMTVRRSLSGDLVTHVLSSAGTPKNYTTMKYTLKVSPTIGQTFNAMNGTLDLEARIAQVRALMGKVHYVHDIYHMNDLASHTTGYRTMFMETVGDFSVVGTSLPYFLVDVTLKEISV